VGVIGVDADQHLLVIARDEDTDALLRLREITGGLAAEPDVVRREVAVGAVSEKRGRRRINLIDTVPQTFGDAGSILSWFATCSLCGDCLDACPLYDGELTRMLGVRSAQSADRPVLAALVDVGRWLASCSGCGMCEEACHNHVPLSLLSASLSHRIRDRLHYTAGDPAQKLPWAS
jgi:CO dehydrogenase/acetyl-CoA synthase alpha subunit